MLSANENTLASGKKTIMPADVFKAIEETEFGFMRAKLEAEFTSSLPPQGVSYLFYQTKLSYIALTFLILACS